MLEGAVKAGGHKYACEVIRRILRRSVITEDGCIDGFNVGRLKHKGCYWGHWSYKNHEVPLGSIDSKVHDHGR